MVSPEDDIGMTEGVKEVKRMRLTGGALLLPLLISSNLSWVLTVNGMLIVIHLGLLATALAY